MQTTCHSSFEVYKENWFALFIAIWTGCGSEKALKTMEVYPPDGRKSNGIPDKYSDEQRVEMVKLKEQGWTFNEIGAKYGVSGQAIRGQYFKELSRRGIQPPDLRSKKSERIRLRSEQRMGADVSIRDSKDKTQD